MEHPGLSTIGKGTVLEDPGLSDYWVCVKCLGPLYVYQHQEAWDGPLTCSQLCKGRLWKDKQPYCNAWRTWFGHHSRTETTSQGFTVLLNCVWPGLRSIYVIFYPYPGQYYKRSQHEIPCTTVVRELNLVFLCPKHNKDVINYHNRLSQRLS